MQRKNFKSKDIIVRSSYSRLEGNTNKSRTKVDLNDPDNMLDRKHSLNPRKLCADYSHDSWINWRYLTRFFHAHLGEPFSDVYSKLCEMADSRSWAGKTWRDQIINNELVHSKPCEEREDGLYTLEGHKVCGLRYYNDYRSQYYMDAEGILRETTKKSKPVSKYIAKEKPTYRSRTETPHAIKVAKNTFLIKADGNWWQVETRDLNYLDTDPNKTALLHKLTADVDKDVILYHKLYSPIYKEKFLSYRWEELIRKTYCGELRVGVSKITADPGLVRNLGLLPCYTGGSPYCNCDDPENCGKKHQNLKPKKERDAEKAASLEALLKLFEE